MTLFGIIVTLPKGGGEPLFLKEWLEAGILTIRDIVDEAGFIDYLEIRQKMKSRAARATCFFDLERVKKGKISNLVNENKNLLWDSYRK